MVRDKYRVVATDPRAGFHFHTGRALAARLGDPRAIVDSLPDRAVESFAGVADPLNLRAPECCSPDIRPRRAAAQGVVIGREGTVVQSPRVTRLITRGQVNLLAWRPTPTRPRISTKSSTGSPIASRTEERTASP
jgi:hypothetical protein